MENYFVKSVGTLEICLALHLQVYVRAFIT